MNFYYIGSLVIAVFGVILVVAKDWILNNESDNYILSCVYKYNYIVGSIFIAAGYYSQNYISNSSVDNEVGELIQTSSSSNVTSKTLTELSKSE